MILLAPDRLWKREADVDLLGLGKLILHIALLMHLASLNDGALPKGVGYRLVQCLSTI